MVENTIHITAIIREGPTYTLDQAQFGIKIGDLDVQCYVHDAQSITFLQTHKIRIGHAVSVTGRLRNLSESLFRGVQPILLITDIRLGVRRSPTNTGGSTDRLKLKAGKKRPLCREEPMDTDKTLDVENRKGGVGEQKDGASGESPITCKRVRVQNGSKQRLYTEFKENDECYFFMLYGRITYLRQHLDSEQIDDLNRLLDDMYGLYQANSLPEFAQTATCLHAMLRVHYNGVVKPLPACMSLPQLVYLPTAVYIAVTNSDKS
ncbi:hypothetical protein DFQ28_006249 [Apophysomyces sp. BC1034]|nr:hypothetical protein DFQ29_005067 [Apophysomyces sp. BC1021]KAG0187516.1 hypothetical protein DFQ28_006249 [Apophysomyces sp. BC1034]